MIDGMGEKLGTTSVPLDAFAMYQLKSLPRDTSVVE